MFKFIKWLISNDFEYLPMNYCEGKSSKELLEKLKSGYISVGSGHMIVTELLDRLINDNKE